MRIQKNGLPPLDRYFLSAGTKQSRAFLTTHRTLCVTRIEEIKVILFMNKSHRVFWAIWMYYTLTQKLKLRLHSFWELLETKLLNGYRWWNSYTTNIGFQSWRIPFIFQILSEKLLKVYSFWGFRYFSSLFDKNSVIASRNIIDFFLLQTSKLGVEILNHCKRNTKFGNFTVYMKSLKINDFYLQPYQKGSFTFSCWTS